MYLFINIQISLFDHSVVADHLPVQQEMQTVVLKKASKVGNFHLKTSDLIFPNEKCINPFKTVHNNSHFLLLQDSFPAVRNWSN
jgi:hypothetical protein